MARRGGKMSENLKAEIAKELGVYNVVKDEGWGVYPPGTVVTWSVKPLRLQKEM